MFKWGSSRQKNQIEGQGELAVLETADGLKIKKKKVMENNRFFSRVQLLDLSQKAESVVVNQLDKRLSNIEILLNQNFMTKEEFHRFSQDLQNRLSKIEYQLSEMEKR
jgi:hypothetical protein